MKVVILCGGKGTRISEVSSSIPKPMLEIGGKPILWHIMKIYAHYGYRDFVLALGYGAGYIKDYFLKQKHYDSDFVFNTKDGNLNILNDDLDDFNISFVNTGLDTPHGERVLKLKDTYIDDTFMVTYGDGIADINLEDLIKFHKEKGVIATITGAHPSSRWGLVNFDNETGLIKEFAQKPLVGDYINGGFMICNKEFFNFLQEGDMIEDAFPKLIAQKQLALYRHEGFWYGMDTPKDYHTLNELWDEGDPKWKVWEKK
ncbi:MAG: sugar phosphate nucleotidyltransferase [Parcubacteria group bacterium]|jgi:glucose-1-phosphate cytidylyltransferase